MENPPSRSLASSVLLAAMLAAAPGCDRPGPAAKAVPAPAVASAEPPVPSKQLAFLRDVCRVAVKGDTLGCACCPPFAECPPGPETDKVEARLTKFVAGSFTRAGADQVAATFRGCEARPQRGGGTVLAERPAGSTGQYRQVRYTPGQILDGCRPFRRDDGRDLFACRWDSGLNGLRETTVFVDDLASPDNDLPDAPPSTSLVYFLDTIAGYCDVKKPGEPLRSVRLDEMVVRGAGPDGRPQLVLRVSDTSGVVDDAYQRKCKETFSSERDVDLRDALPRPRHQSIVILFDGSGFRVAEESRGVVTQLAAEPPRRTP